MAGGFQAGAIFAELALDSKQFLSGLRAASTGLRSFATRVRVVMQKVAKTFLNPVRGIQKLIGFITTIKGALVGLAAYKFVELGARLQGIREGFVNLQSSIGVLASDTLQALREATHGAVSDLSLMQATNNAVLLGVGKSTEDFRDLATAARRLGRAVGRNVVDAYNDLAFGIGRQSRLILDNLGLVVKVGQANQDYAAALGKTVDQLSIAEQRMAFTTAAMDAIHKKLKQLGPDSDTFVESFGRMRAMFVNVATDIASGLIPMFKSLFDIITKFITRFRPQIQSIAAFVGELGQAVILLIRDIIQKTIEMPAAVWHNIKVFFVTATIVITQGLKSIGQIVFRLVAAIIDKSIDYIGSRLSTLPDLLEVKFAEILYGKKSFTATFARWAYENITEAAREKLLSKPLVSEDVIRKSFTDIAEFIDVFQKGTKQLWQDIQAGPLATTFENFANRVEAASQKLKISFTETDTALQELQKTVEHRRIKPLSEIFGDFISRPKGIETTMFEDLYAKPLREMNKAFEEQLRYGNMKGVRQEIEKMKILMEEFGKDAIKATTAQIDIFNAAINRMKQNLGDLAVQEVTQEIKSLQTELDQIGMTSMEKLNQKWKKWLDALIASGQLTNKQIAVLRDYIATIDQLSSRLEKATKASKQRKAFGVSLGQDLADTIAGGIAEGFRQGLRPAKVFANVLQDLFTNSIRRSVEKLGDAIGEKLGQIFAKSASMASFGMLGQGLLGIAGAIFSNLRGTTENVAADIKSAVESTEAVRGIVAGPTDVPIARVGNALKEALRTTELLLERIARAVESTGGGIGRTAMPGHAYAASTSSAT